MNNRIKEIRARLEKAQVEFWGPNMIHNANQSCDGCDADLIINAPADLAFLLGEIERLSTECKGMGRLLEKSVCIPTEEYQRLTAQLKVAVVALRNIQEANGAPDDEDYVTTEARETPAAIAVMEGK